MHVLSTEATWLHRASMEEGPLLQVAPKLSPRLRDVLLYLLQGNGRKEIASKLNLSTNTVHGYMKEIYAVMEVGSHAELLARYLAGNGMDGVG
ncbi:MAG: hypothetical protein HN341_10290 [Verrucomicrobia bacterium]|jgi:DNA-binding NarL/FixJ family response regulator|nr:hypothetical protein [Verrucomicrobiota bacterium]